MTPSANTKLAAPASTAYKIVEVPEATADVIKRHAMAGAFVSSSKQEGPWVRFGSQAATRHLVFDTGRHIFSNVLWMKPAGVIGTHKHRGTVVMVCLEGSARYLEYEWPAEGDFIYEAPGLIHTLVSDDDPKGVKRFGGLQGPIEFDDERGSLVETTEVWWFLNHYRNDCRHHGIPINQQLYF